MNSPWRKRAGPFALGIFGGLLLLGSAGAAKCTAYLELAPMIGHTSSTNARIWAKASGPARLSVQLGEKPDLMDGWTVRGPKLDANTACMGQLVVGHLHPATRYYYRLLLDGKPAMLRPYPSFTTAPTEGGPGRVRFAFTSC